MKVNDHYELAGIHTGSSREPRLEEDIAYATPAFFIDVLTTAYYNGGKSSFPFYLEDQPIFDLNVDEFISHIQVENETGENIWKKNVYYKFPYRELLDALNGARYVEFSINRVQWKDGVLMESRANPRLVRYDLQDRKIVEPVSVE